MLHGPQHEKPLTEAERDELVGEGAAFQGIVIHSETSPVDRRMSQVRDDLLAMVAENTGLPVRFIRIAVRYWASYPDEVDAETAAADTAEAAAEDAWRRQRRLLAG